MPSETATIFVVRTLLSGAWEVRMAQQALDYKLVTSPLGTTLELVEAATHSQTPPAPR